MSDEMGDPAGWRAGWSEADIAAARKALLKWQGGVMTADEDACPVEVLLRNNGLPDSAWAPRIPIGVALRPDRPPLTKAEAEIFAAAWNAGMAAMHGPGHGRAAVILP